MTLVSLKLGVFVHPRRPKIPRSRVLRDIRSLGIACVQEDPDIALVVGGDGTFGYYGRILPFPMLFVGVRELGITGSKAKLAETYYDDLARALEDIAAGKHSVEYVEMLSARVKGSTVDFLTDIYLERGTMSGCLRYKTTVMKPHTRTSFTDYAIGNGVIVSTSFGAGGYYSYPDRLSSWAHGRRQRFAFSGERIGICHIIPTSLARKENGGVAQSDKFRYTVPMDSMIRIGLSRNADARLYGTTSNSRGIPVDQRDTIIVTRANKKAKIVKL